MMKTFAPHPVVTAEKLRQEELEVTIGEIEGISSSLKVMADQLFNSEKPLNKDGSYPGINPSNLGRWGDGILWAAHSLKNIAQRIAEQERDFQQAVHGEASA